VQGLVPYPGFVSRSWIYCTSWLQDFKRKVALNGGGLPCGNGVVLGVISLGWITDVELPEKPE